jgi:hypothetical protein
MAYTKYSLTPADNNAAPPNGAPEGMLPSAVNDTMRDMMSQIRDAGDGIRNGTYTMTAPVITGGSITGVALTGNTFTNPIITGGTLTSPVITGGTITGITDLAVADGGTGASTAENARLNLSAVGYTTTTGSVIITSGTSAQRDGSPVNGYFRYNSETNLFEGYVNGAWGNVGGGQYFGLAATKAIAYNSRTIAENVTVTAGNNGLSAGPITIDTGFTVTVQTNAAWVIV